MFKNFIDLILTIFLLSLQRGEYAGKSDEKLSEGDSPLPGYEEKEQSEKEIERQKNLAEEFGYDYTPPAPKTAEEEAEAKRIADEEARKKAEAEAAGSSDEKKTDEEIVEVKIDSLTKESAVEALKDFADDDEVQIRKEGGGTETLTKAELLKRYEEADKPKEYTAGKHKLDQAAYDKTLADMKKLYEWDDNYVKNRREKDLLKDIETHLNKQDATKKVNEGFQQNARLRRQIEQSASNYERQYKQLEDDKAELEAAKIKNQALLERKPSEFDNIEDDDEREEKKRELHTEQFLAKREQEKIEKDLKKHTKTIEEIDVQVDNLGVYSAIIDIQDTIPELRLSDNPSKILQDIKTGKSHDLAAGRIANFVLKVARDYYREFLQDPESGLRVSDWFELNKFNYNLPAVLNKSSENGRKDTKENKTDKKTKRLLRILTGQAGAPYVPKGTSGDFSAITDAEEKRLAEQKERAGIEDDYSRFVGE